MINDFNDFCTWMYIVTDHTWLKIVPFFKRPGPRLECPDSELLAMALIGECRGWDVETEMHSQWHHHLLFIRYRKFLSTRQCANLIKTLVNKFAYF